MKNKIQVICLLIGAVLAVYGTYVIIYRYANPIIAGAFYLSIGLLFVYTGRQERKKGG